MPIDTSFALYSLSDDEQRTLESIESQGKDTHVLVMPTHHIDAVGRMSAFRFTAPGSAIVGSAPFTHDMFSGLAVCEVAAGPADLARLIASPEQCRKLLEKVVADTTAACNSDTPAPADLDCNPRDMHGVHFDGTTRTRVASAARCAVDTRTWAPDPPTLLGVYQAHVRSAAGERRHAIFVACEGGCARAANEYHNMMLDLGDEATLSEAVECSETWWLRRASSRARNHLMYQAATALGLAPRAVTLDTHAFAERRVAAPLCETLHHDIQRGPHGTVQLLNHAVDTTRVQNGVLCKMNPAEGLWLFRGAPRTHAATPFGSMFGDAAVCGCFPTSAFRFDDKQHPGVTVGAAPRRERWLHFNNGFLQHLQEMGWDSDYGVVELIPLAVVHG